MDAPGEIIGLVEMLNPKQQRFVEEYLVDLCGAAAARRAGYSGNHLHQQVSALLSLPSVAVAVSRGLKERSERVKIDAAWVLYRAALLANFNIKKFITVLPDGSDAYYDFSQATDDDWYCIQEYTRNVTPRGKTLLPIKSVKLKAVDKIRALELVGKHVDVAAFKDQITQHNLMLVNHVERVVVEAKYTDR